jgi:hypothetical protein
MLVTTQLRQRSCVQQAPRLLNHPPCTGTSKLICKCQPASPAGVSSSSSFIIAAADAPPPPQGTRLIPPPPPQTTPRAKAHAGHYPPASAAGVSSSSWLSSSLRLLRLAATTNRLRCCCCCCWRATPDRVMDPAGNQTPRSEVQRGAKRQQYTSACHCDAQICLLWFLDKAVRGLGHCHQSHQCRGGAVKARNRVTTHCCSNKAPGCPRQQA